MKYRVTLLVETERTEEEVEGVADSPYRFVWTDAGNADDEITVERVDDADE